ncbi:alpha/beta fold hydrolase [Paenibacillus sp. HW567]|uniref:alpha/beta fold hydrolase n=1 Tax=Paenibacillus sp. HW567 TaxID=1034769 RepID=UPI0003604C12|nr:alpha/beta fold hydrolase [Paenibacillus sp. HW567]
MSKKITFFLVCILLLGGWSWPAPAAHGAGLTVKFSIDNEVLKFPAGGNPYVTGNTVMVPIGTAGKTLGLEVVYSKKDKLLQLSRNGQQISLKLGSSEVLINGKDKLVMDGKAVQQNNRIYVPLSLFNAMGLVTSYDSASAQAAVNTPQNYLKTVVNLLVSEKFEVLFQRYFSEDVKKALPAAGLQQAWESTAALFGEFIKLSNVTSHSENGQIIIAGKVSFLKGDLVITTAVNSSGKIIGLRFSLPASSAPELKLPEGVTEEDVTVGAGTAHPLKGVLTLPKNAAHPLPSVVLVQGSGASDYDETAYAYKPFRDIAYGLARQGIAVIRYDKRNHAYPQEFTGAAGARITVKEETVEDAIAAAKLLKQDNRLDPGKVYLTGHSLGGMLAPRIDADGGDFAGLILLAGTPRSLWEIMYDQNKAFLDAMDNANPLKAQGNAALDAELTKAKSLSALTLEQALAAPDVFNTPVYYFKEMDSHNTADLARKLTKPVLVLQGSDDFQVYADKDFPLWKEVLKGDAAASFKLYPGLNHFFINYDGAGAGTTAEYNIPGMVDSQVITDIGEWIKAQQ